MQVSPFIRDLPKAELHLHIEGTLEPELMLHLAARNQVSLPFDSAEDARAVRSFSSLDEFLAIYFQSMSVLVTQDDFCDLTCAYLDKAAAQGVQHAEIFFDPQAHTARGIDFATVCHGIRDGLQYGRERHGITSRLIMCFLRHLEESDAITTLAEAMPYRQWIYGVGLDSSESGHPPSKFANVFAQAKAAGFACVAHAGEEGPHEYVREAVDTLGVQRIDHGCRVLDDPVLTSELAGRAMPFTVCPLSNYRLGVVDSLDAHPLKKMLEAGLAVTINSDDPAFFGGYINENYQAAQDHLGIDDATLAQIARNSFNASFLDGARRFELLARLDTYVEGFDYSPVHH